jgi:alkylation response protein AidB-like acyl-CoA dehydrogenase
MSTLTEQRAEIIDAVRAFTADELAPHARDWDDQAYFPADVLRRAGAFKLGGLYVRPDVGGAGLSRADAVPIFEELARGDTAVAAYTSIHNMVAWTIDEYGTPEQRQQFVPKLVTLEHFGSYCLTEPGGGSDAAALTTEARRDGDEYVLNGVKQFISGAGESAVYLVMARTGGPGAGGISAIIVPAGADGLSFGPVEKKMGWHAQPTRQVIMQDVRVPVGNRLGGEHEGFAIALAAINNGRIMLSSCSVGGGQWALDQALRYVQERQAFGKPLAANQGLVFMLADMATDLEAARGLLQRAATAIDTNAPDATMLCAMAKRFATDAGFAAANSALQMHGGNGYFQEYGIERVVRDLRVHQIAEGANEIMRVIVGRELLGHAR